MEALTASEPLATCGRCGVRVRFMPGFEPRLRRWRDGVCPACHMREARARVERMSIEEKRQAVLEELRREPTASVRALSRATGLDRPTVVAARQEAVRLGIIAADPLPDMGGRGRNSPTRRRAHLESDATIVQANPGITRGEFAGRFGLTHSSAARRLDGLVKHGLARRINKAGGRARIAYEPVSTSQVERRQEPPSAPLPPPQTALSHP